MSVSVEDNKSFGRNTTERNEYYSRSCLTCEHFGLQVDNDVVMEICQSRKVIRKLEFILQQFGISTNLDLDALKLHDATPYCQVQYYVNKTSFHNVKAKDYLQIKSRCVD